MARGGGFGLYLAGDQAVLSLKELAPSSSHDKRPVVRRSDVVRMKVVGANRTAHYTAAEALPGKSHYYLGSNPADWRTNVPQYGRVSYKGVYPGIDLTYYGNQRQREYDLEIARAAPRQPPGPPAWPGSPTWAALARSASTELRSTRSATPTWQE